MNTGRIACALLAALLAAGVRFYAVLGNHDRPDIDLRYPPFNMRGRPYYVVDRLGENIVCVATIVGCGVLDSGWRRNDELT